MANPFLMEDEPFQSNETYLNPFLLEDLEDENNEYTDNPFAGQGTNPFAGFEIESEEIIPTTTAIDFFETESITTSNEIFLSNSTDEKTVQANKFDSVSQSTHFFDTTINEDEPLQKPIDLNIKNPNTVAPYDDSAAYSSEDELKFKKKPPRPPPSKATQDLIMSVANELDQASSHLLDRLPKTRTPSPISMRDLHSPSPTPDIGFGDLIDGLDDQDQNNYFNDDLMTSTNIVMDNPFVDNDLIKEDVNKNQPPRPPPPRPTPPAVPQRPSPITQQPPPIPNPPYSTTVPQQEQDFIDIFGTNNSVKPPKPPPPKTTQDILSLYTAPAQANTNNEKSKIPDLMSGDILDESFSIEDKPTVDLLSDFSNSIIESQEQTVERIPDDSEDNSEIQSTFIDEQLPQDYPEPITEEESCENQELLFNNMLDQSNSNRASVFNMTVTCEPDNPPSSDEDMNEEASPEQQIVQDTEPTPEVGVESIIGITSESVLPTEEDVNPFGSPSKDSPILESFQANTTSTGVIQHLADLSQTPQPNIFGIPEEPESMKVDDSFDAFSAKFESADNRAKSPNVFMDDIAAVSNGSTGGDAWGDSSSAFNDGEEDGFGVDERFDSFVAMNIPPGPKNTPFDRTDSHDSDEPKEEFNVFIRPKEDVIPGTITPILAPPPKSSQNNSMYSGDSSPRFNPFDKGFEDVSSAEGGSVTAEKILPLERTESQESPSTPLFDDDVSQPLEDFPRLNYTGDGWEMQLRQPNKKRITAQRFWKKIIMKLALQGDNPVLQLYNSQTDKEPFQELPLQACYSVSDISAQQYDQYGKIFTAKLQYIFYKERPGVRPGQVTKAERITNKLSQFAAYAIQGDYQGVKEFGSDLKKLGLPVEHAPQLSELFKLGSLSFEDMKQFSFCIDEALFKLDVHRDRALNYKTEEVQITAVDELYVDQDAEGHVLKQIARVRLYFLGFLSGMPYVELGVNDLWRQGKEVVGRHDIIPVVTEEWIRLEGVEFHSCVHQEEYERSRTIKFQPPDACYIELMRFRIRPPKNRELPLQLKATWCVTGNKVDLRADILVPGFASRKLGQIPCEDVMIRFPIPECWIYLFRVEKHFRYGSVKSAHRRTGKVKGIERILGAVDQLQESLIEVTSGNAKYEHQHRALVWRCPRLPKEGQGAYTTHQLVCRLALTSYDQIPDQLAPFCYVEFTMPATQVSHTTVRSVSIQESESDDPPEKYVRYLARHEYKVGIEHTTNETSNPYNAATMIKTTIREEPAPPPKTPLSPVAAVAQSDSDSDSN